MCPLFIFVTFHYIIHKQVVVGFFIINYKEKEVLQYSPTFQIP